MDASRTIAQLFDDIESDNLRVCGLAWRKLIERYDECHDYTDVLMDKLGDSNAAISDNASIVLSRIGNPAVRSALNAFDRSTGKHRRYLMSLIAGASEFAVWYPVLHDEFVNGEYECRCWAANLLCRQYNPDEGWGDWPADAQQGFIDAIKFLRTLRQDPQQGANVRFTFQHVGFIEK